ncbi:hypothetical protein N7466_001641 [Penicillium verhagenii]|uniref:uncharacterized protein n=1 Tax=Penicillium verhagenii TaxID=1562060 RepID=UPI0025454E8B|nr:uncharacterized protein N7466_001641 [Penicillium verhagenii]KAJ5938507.1 hypothetical protein N7466_001641 [Penicillium verhagenii]
MATAPQYKLCDIKGLRRGQLRHQGTPQGTAATPRDSAGDSCDTKGLRRGQLRHQGTPQGTAATPRDSAGDSCDTKGLRRGQLRHQGTPQGEAAKLRNSSKVQAPLRGARDQYSTLALQLKKPRPAPTSIDHLCRLRPRAKRLAVGPGERIPLSVFTPR